MLVTVVRKYSIKRSVYCHFINDFTFFVFFVSGSLYLVKNASLPPRETNVNIAIKMDVIYISQRSIATHLKCGRIVSNSIITNFLPILTVK